jgi:hypothetical protein
MANRIKNMGIMNGRLTPTEAHLHVFVYPEFLYSSTLVRGRVVGPSCAYSSTVEVAYDLRETSREYESTGIPHIGVQAIIPEPCLWDPESPFLYRIIVELWQKGDLCEQQSLSHAFHESQLGPKGLRWNGRPFLIRGRAVKSWPEETRSLHEAGFNTLLVPVSEPRWWLEGDRLGFLILGRITVPEDVRRIPDVKEHPSALGWVLNAGLLNHEIIRAIGPSFLAGARDLLIGLELEQAPTTPIPNGFSFILCREHLLSSVTGINLPTMILVPDGAARSSTSLLGSIHEVAQP